MHAPEWDQEHDHDHERDHGHGHGHENDEPVHTSRTSEGREPADTPHLYRAAAAGRSDVVGAGGMSVLQRAVGNSAVGSMLQRKEEEERSPVHDVVSSGGGQPLDTDTRADLEGRMGADFSDVRVHTDSAAHESAKGVGAHAYTVGNNVVFQRDAYDPSSPQGRTTLAHELTHVIQQRNGPVDGTEAAGGIRVSDPSDRFEREAVANADRVLSDPAPASAPVSDSASAPASAASNVQRAATEDEDEQPADVQGLFVQRAEEGAEEEQEAPPE
ncbi:eCIS core domain-containing protein [Streptomyces sp. Wh19]|uniref:eCIS core domain-containing protein n=1 Tax=Streptomyces sp. Wh19 TaxID=3076629 RepID=UPI003FA36B2C